MSSEIHIFVIESCFYESYTRNYDEEGNILDIKSIAPVEGLKLDEIDILKEMASEYIGNFCTNPVSSVTLVDPNYQIKYFYTKEGKQHFKELSKILNTENSNIRIVNKHWHDFIESYIFDPINHYFFITKKKFDNCYKFFNYLGLHLSNNFYCCYSAKSMQDINKSKCYFNIFNASKEKTSIQTKPTFDSKAVEFMVNYALDTLEQMKLAGFHKKENFVQNIIESWVLNVESYFTKGVILEKKINPANRIINYEGFCFGNTRQEAFCESAEYRFMVYFEICNALANLGVYLKLFKKDEISEVLSLDFSIFRDYPF